MRAGHFPSSSPSRPPVTQCLPLLTCLLQGGTCPSLWPLTLSHIIFFSAFFFTTSTPITCCLTVSRHSALLSNLCIYTYGLGHTQCLHHSCGQTVEALAWIWNLRQGGDFRSHDSAQSFTGLSVGLYDTGFCKSRAIYTLVVISTERYLRYIS